MAEGTGTAQDTRRRSITRQLQDAAGQNSELLHTLSSTHTAPGDLQRTFFEIKDLRNLISEQDVIVENLAKNAKRDLKQHRRYRDSKIHRFVYRITNRPQQFDAKAMKEEQMYHDTLQEQHRAEDRRSELNVNLTQALNRERDLSVATSAHSDAHEKLDWLYENIFTGPNPDYPEEDLREEAYYNAQREYHQRKDGYKESTDNVKLLREAFKALRTAKYRLQSAESDLDSSFFGLGDRHVEALLQSQAKSLEASNLVTLAKVPSSRDPQHQQAKLAIQARLRSMSLPEFFSDQDTLQYIHNRRQILERASEDLVVLIDSAKKADDRMKGAFRSSARSLEDSRQALHQARQAVFEFVAGFGEAPPSYPEAAPEIPSYTECCDRAAAFERVDFELASTEDEDNGTINEGNLTVDGQLE